MPRRKGVKHFNLDPMLLYRMYYGGAIILIAVVFLIGVLLNQCQGHLPDNKPKKVGLYYFEPPFFFRALPAEPVPVPWDPEDLDLRRLA